MSPTKLALALSSLFVVLTASAPTPSSAEDARRYLVGVSKVDITPDYPIRLNGFGNRREESEGVSQRIFAKALAISQADEPPLVLVTLDSLGIRASHVEQVLRALTEKHTLPKENLVVTFTHSHCTPKVSGSCDNIFSTAIPADHQRHIDRYTKELIEKMTQAAESAIAGRRPATMEWSAGTVRFAKNRRTPGGPVDHALPTLVVRDAEGGGIRAVYVSYACHAVTLSFNQISGDWPGYAAELIEKQHPGAVALVSIGAGSDSNPIPGVQGDNVDLAREQGAEIAAEAERLLRQGPRTAANPDGMRPIAGAPAASAHRIQLALNDLPTREQLVEIAENGRRPTDRYNATTQLARLDRGEPLLKEMDYPIHTWWFGDQFCLTYLSGEVCVDYSIRLKGELDRERYWLNAYSNDFGCYIPSERLVKEGGYGGGAETPYFALPTTLKAGLEQQIVAEAKRQAPAAFHVPQGVRGIAPKTPAESMGCIELADKDLVVELVAAEPLVTDPVAIDFSPDGGLWVAEMNDYGRGVYEQFQQAGRVRRLVDADQDGRMDSATTFVEGLRFPTDVKSWRDGVLICDAPDILWARDTDNDGKADQVETLFSGFEERNAQARVNSLRWGLDQWLHGSCGLFGGEIHSHRTGKTASLASRDFRLLPDTGAIEAAAGRTQQGRCRNDWGDWFGCSNGTLLMHYASNEHYASRNPLVSLASPASLQLTAGANSLIPPAQLVQFELTGQPGKATSACGLGMLRDTCWPDDYPGSALVCEPVHQSVHRIALRRDGHGYAGDRGRHEEAREFLSSSDRWFRPVQVRIGPDGAVWVVDMYRFVIEHSRWIPQAMLAELDVLAGRQRGRIYRIAPRGQTANSWRVSDSQPDQMLEMLLSPNGELRDLAHQWIAWEPTRLSPELRERFRESLGKAGPEIQIQGISLLAQLPQLDPSATRQWLLGLLESKHPEVLRHVVRNCEPWLDGDPAAASLREAIMQLATHADPKVRRQVAWTLGESRAADVMPSLVQLLSLNEADAVVRSAALSSIRADTVSLALSAYQELPEDRQAADTLASLMTMAARVAPNEPMLVALSQSVPRLSGKAADVRLLVRILNALDARDDAKDLHLPKQLEQAFVAILIPLAMPLSDSSATDAAKRQCCSVFGRPLGVLTRKLLVATGNTDLGPVRLQQQLAQWVSPEQSAEVQAAAIAGLTALGDVDGGDSVATLLLLRHRNVTHASRVQILDALLGHHDWTKSLVDAMRAGDVRPSALNAAQRKQLATHADGEIRAQSAQLFADVSGRAKVVEAALPVLQRKPDVEHGREVFRKKCATCHRVEDNGFVVGPDLTALTNRDPRWLLRAVLDPNQAVDNRYLSWSARHEDGRVLTGLIMEESGAAIQLRELGGKQHELLRSELEALRCNEVSLMPEGLERELNEQDLCDVVRYVAQLGGAPAADETPRYAPQIAPYLLKDGPTVEDKQRVLDQRPGMGPAVVSLLVNNLDVTDMEEQYRRIPWIWRTAITVGKRNDGGELRDLLEVSLPNDGEPLLDWQAVVVGGGVINGLTLVHHWPDQRIADVLGGAPQIAKRWLPALKLSVAMAHDSSVRPGTRYDALRMVALLPADVAIPELTKYLSKDAERSLQMGAVSGLGDIRDPRVAPLLVDSLAGLQPRNRQLALEALFRTDDRLDVLRKAAAATKGVVLTDADLKPLREHGDLAIRRRALSW
ncbi:MAG: neutral/alkaline non-lysosomal ceramidase N-terminal domain-containing protein [Planctomycetales bacterium]|nr:neutral/alkaline non-lysosomal ceramidase N-terminal domain-containing protein [Planctomycetales bacterium]